MNPLRVTSHSLKHAAKMMLDTARELDINAEADTDFVILAWPRDGRRAFVLHSGPDGLARLQAAMTEQQD